MGPFSLSAYEVIAVGIGANCDGAEYAGDAEAIADKVRSVWTNDVYRQYSGSGVRGSARLPHLVPLGRALFAP